MVTVIIPVYNVQDCLARCVESVLEQTHRDLEIILVDDGSSDSSGSMCDEMATRDSRVKVVHKPNGGLSSARNAGLDAMTGDYVTFIDADDYVHRRFVETLLGVMSDNRVQVAVCDWQEFNEGEMPRPVGNEVPAPVLYPSMQALEMMLYQQGITHSACSRLFSASVFAGGLRFREGALYEDLAIIYDLMKQVTTLAWVDVPLYYYVHRAGGSITSTVTPKRAQVLEHLDCIEKKAQREAPQLLPAVRSRKLSACFNMLRIMDAHDRQWIPIKNESFACIRQLRGEALSNPRVRARNKIACLISFLGLRILMVCLNKR